MEWIALILAVVALILSIWAIKRTGGLVEMKAKVDALSKASSRDREKRIGKFKSKQ